MRRRSGQPRRTITTAGDELKAPFRESDMQNVLAAELTASIAAWGPE